MLRFCDNRLYIREKKAKKQPLRNYLANFVIDREMDMGLLRFSNIFLRPLLTVQLQELISFPCFQHVLCYRFLNLIACRYFKDWSYP